jgi:predicted nucleotidyltransferase
MIDLLEQHRQQIADICRRYGVKRLEVFGSAVRGDFDPQTSDVDFLVEFLDDDWHHAADNWFGMIESLEQVLGRTVELVSAPDVKNRYFLEAANRTRTELYAA